MSCMLFDYRAQPLHSFDWGSQEPLVHVQYNPTEMNIVGYCGGDRSICLYDTRTKSALKRFILKMRSNAMCWNPMEAFNFTIANEDSNLYTYDMRKLDVRYFNH